MQNWDFAYLLKFANISVFNASRHLMQKFLTAISHAISDKRLPSLSISNSAFGPIMALGYPALINLKIGSHCIEDDCVIGGVRL